MQMISVGLATNRSFNPRTTAPWQAPLTWLAPFVDAQSDDLSLNRTKELLHEEVEHRPPLEILAELRPSSRRSCRGSRSWRGCCDDPGRAGTPDRRR